MIRYLTGIPSLVVFGLFAFAVASCGEESAGQQQQGTSTGSDDAVMQDGRYAADQKAGVEFWLLGKNLGVRVNDDAPDSIQRLLTERLQFFCGTASEFAPFGASARATGRFPVDTNYIEVELSRDVSENVAFCGVEPDEGAGEAFGFYIPLEEILEESQKG